ncbi:MAG: enoyl-CoA hydratase/isomerase family protein, partial [Pseudomonadota bacterium]
VSGRARITKMVHIRLLTAPDAPDWAQAAGRSLEDRSPLALALFLEAVRRAADAADLEAALATEYRLVTRLDDQGEFPEGVRALIIDKDRAPKWQYAALDDVPDQTIADFFAPLADRAELWA